ncbi:MAG: hypothetical protein ABIH88_00260 [Patescibacteria group bacterium]
MKKIWEMTQARSLKRGDLFFLDPFLFGNRKLGIFLGVAKDNLGIIVFMMGDGKELKLPVPDEVRSIYWFGARLSSDAVSSILGKPEEKEYEAGIWPISFWQRIGKALGVWPRRLLLKRVKPGRIIAFLNEKDRDGKCLRIEVITSSMICDFSRALNLHFRCLSLCRDLPIQEVERNYDDSVWALVHQRVVDLGITLPEAEMIRLICELQNSRS